MADARCARRLTRLGMIASFAWLAGCQAAATPAAAPLGVTAAPVAAPVSVRVGTLGGSDPIASIGLQKGYFAAQGIDIEPSAFQTTQDMVAPLAAGQLDVGSGSFSAGFFNAAARGLGIKCVAGIWFTPPGHPVNQFVLRTAVASQIHGPADLKGRTVGLTAHGVSPELELAKLLEQVGLGLHDVDEVLLPFPDMVTGTSSGKLDLAIVPQTIAIQMELSGVGTIWKGDDEILPNQQQTCLLFGPQFIAGQPAVAQGFVTAYLRSARAYNDAFVKRDPAARAEVISILIATTTLKDPAIYEKMAGNAAAPDGQQNLDSMRIYQDFFLSSGLQQESIDLTQLVDTHFVDAALRAIGPAQP